MAENELGETGRALQVALEKPVETPPLGKETAEAHPAEEPRSPLQTLHSEAATGEELGQEKALVEALRVFVRHEAGKAEPPPTERIGARQAIVLVLFSLDIALIYSQVNRWLQNPLLQEAMKLVPWLLGATAVGYADRLRQVLLNQARHLTWLALAAFLLVPLLLSNMRVFSFRVRVPSLAFTVKPSDSRVEVREEGSGLYGLVFPSLDAYRFEVKGPEEKENDWRAFPVTLTRRQILRGTLTQLPLAGSIFGGQELRWSPLYNVFTHSATEAQVEVEGQFQEGFFQKESLKAARCQSARAKKEGGRAAKCYVAADYSGFALPPGTYDFTLPRCPKAVPYEVKALGAGGDVNEKNEMIDLDKPCPK